MSKSVCRAANWVNIASCQLALGTVLTLIVTLGRSLVYSALAKSSSAWAGGHSNQMKLRSIGSSVSFGMVAGALAPPAESPPPSSSSPPPPPQAARASAARTAAEANRTVLGRDRPVARFTPCIVFSPDWWMVQMVCWWCFRGSRWCSRWRSRASP